MIAVSRIQKTHLDNQDCLIDFLMDHSYCDKLKFFSEYDDDRYGYKTERARALVERGKK